MKQILIGKARIVLTKKVLEVVDESLSRTTRDNILNSELSLIKGMVLEEKRRCVMINIIKRIIFIIVSIIISILP